MKKFLFIALLGITAFGCQKEESEVLPNKQLTSHSSLRTINVDPSNSANPYDSLGLLHNQALDYYATIPITTNNINTNLFGATQDFIDGLGFNSDSLHLYFTSPVSSSYGTFTYSNLSFNPANVPSTAYSNVI